MEAESLKYIGAGLATIGMVGSALAVGNIFVALINGIARNPSAEPQLRRSALIGAGLAEALGLFAFLVCILLVFLK